VVCWVEELVAEEGLAVFGWCDVLVLVELVGDVVCVCMLMFRQLFVVVVGSRVVGFVYFVLWF